MIINKTAKFKKSQEVVQFEQLLNEYNLKKFHLVNPEF